MSEITVKTKEILCSLAIIPATLDELAQRDFVKGWDNYTLFTLINAPWARKYWYEDKNDRFHIYAKYREDVAEHIFR